MSKVVEQLKQIQADAHTLVVKFHNYHWNVEGMQFYAIHNYTEEAYEGVFELFDEVAERILQLKEKPLVCVKELADLAKVKKTDKNSFSAKDVVENMKDDYEYLLCEFRKLAKLADEADDRATGAMCDDYIAKYEKALWMINATIA